MARVLAIGNAANANLLLQLDNIVNRLVLNRDKRFGRGTSVSNSVTLLYQLLGSQQGADVLAAKRWVLSENV